jgi:hypothetical protein
MKAYGATKKQYGEFEDYVRKSNEMFANPKLKNVKRRNAKTLKTRERRNNKLV